MQSAISIKLLFSCLVTVLVLIAITAQLIGFINPDSAWLLHAAARVYAGEELYSDVIETNPPLAIYLNLLPVFFADYLVMDKILSFKIFVFALCAASSFLCYRIKPEYFSTVLALLCLFFFAGINFGQREHLFLILFLPYLFCLIVPKTCFSKRILAAIMGGIGVCLKPYFVVIWLAAVIADYINTKKIAQIFRLENWIIGFVGLFYLAYLFFVEKTYVAEILPQLIKYYDSGFNAPIKLLLLAVGQSVTLALMAFAFGLIKFRDKISKEAMLFGACAIGAVATILLQHKGFYNHFMPLGFFALWLNFYLIKGFFSITEKLRRICLVLMCAIVLAQGFYASALASFGMATGYSADDLKREITLINKKALGQNVYYITPDLPDAFPAILYSDGIYRGKYGHLWQLPGMYKGVRKDKNGAFIFRTENEMNADEKQLNTVISNEINLLNPKLVIVKTKVDNYASDQMGDFKFDFLAYFLRNTNFAEKWQEYRKISDIGETSIYIRKENYPKKEKKNDICRH